MRYCYGTCEAIIEYGKRDRYVKDIRLAVIRSVAPDAFDALSDRQNKLSDLARGRDELLHEMVDNACSEDPQDIAMYFLHSVLSHIDDSKYRIVILALQDVIQRDDSIAPEAIVDVVNNLTKEKFLSRKRFTFSKTLAGLFLYAVRRGNNLGCLQDVKKLGKEYFEQLTPARESIDLLSEDISIDPKQIDGLLSEVGKSIASAQNNGVCPECSRPFIRQCEDGCTVDFTDYILSENGNVIPVCVECKRKLEEGKQARICELAIEQDELHEKARLVDISSSESPQRQDIINTLIAIDSMNESESTTSSWDPRRIAEKIPSEVRLRSKIQKLVAPTYEGVQAILNSLSGQNKVNKDRLGRQIKRMWENTQGTPASQSTVFQVIVNNLNVVSGYKHFESCEILVSYYVQRCDVFAPPK